VSERGRVDAVDNPCSTLSGAGDEMMRRSEPRRRVTLNDDR
jgi:hypothetical protein